MSMLSTFEDFARACNENERLRQMNRDWSRTIVIETTDSHQLYWLRSQNGVIEAGEGDVPNADMHIEGTEDIIQAVFSGQMSPTEPYNAGDLLVKGHQDDLMRLDIITLLIWGE
ncbi:SCP2 sterol-binding domain-containing protein [Sulfobacillus thermosulfidooxidans]|uniref:SCP2 sterol-binding domain-containing protein n=1 Tax=Sulfobacillus thermosulfidooxidans TaxID=28034 RepID=UPI00096B8D69|nr:SCP2 sterol-binding domain-containing protein [Sulfobacillus thermosulfidooxidans]OLZ09171.1 sterol carrier protein [Sulfobacillus thermosulfidooxidans]OLZ17736.1 sterol carrier protein [Sulfobacillus thermosulfidooxidans]OLZ22281.1 sterol carrier protein [Sulfobacillus thermosulfidooxidans]